MELTKRPTPRLTAVQRVLEVGMIVTTAFALFLFIALMTFDSADPGWSQTGFTDQINNSAGPAGAWLADIMLWVFGFIAYLFPYAIALVGWFVFQKSKDILEFDYGTIALRVIGSLLCMLGAAGLASINFDDLATVSSGGMVGEAISHALIPFFSIVGTNLLLLCFLATGFTLVTGISWLTIIDGLGELSIFAARKVSRLPQQVNAVGKLPDWRSNKESASDKAENSEEEGASAIEITTMRVETDAEVVSQLRQQGEAAAEPIVEEIDEHSATDFSTSEQDNPPPVTVEVIHQTDDYIAESQPKGVPTPQPAKASTLRSAGIKAEDTAAPEGTVPSFELLDRPNRTQEPISQEELDMVSRLLEAKLADFSIKAEVVGVYPGPVVTRFELDLAPGIKVSKVSGLSKDIARAMSAISVRVVEVIPGKSYIGLELPNKHRETVFLREVISSDKFENAGSNLTMVLGKNISGESVVVDLGKMPHVLVAGTTGSGKSVGVNVMILSLLYKSTPEEVRFIMIDPKMLELSVYEGIPHLLAEVVTDMKEAANALRWCVGEMERRYRLMSALGVRNLKGFNAKVTEAIERGEPIRDPLWKPEQSMDTEAPELEKLPSIVVVVDEFADMMMIVGKKVEELIARIAQKARAAGIHLVLATQRPSVDVITGLIKANIPTRIAFQVSSKIDSRTILDQQGAEALLGMGDMLYLPPGSGVPTRVHGAFVDDHEVHAVVADWKARGEPQYIDEILSGDSAEEILLPGEQPEGEDQEFDAFYDEAVAFVTESRRASVSGVQRKFRIGYNRAARLVEQMEQSGVVSAPGHNGNREVLAPPPPKN